MLSHPGLRAIAAYFFVYYAFLGVFSPFWGPYLRALGVPMSIIGLMISLPQVNRIYAPALWAWCADHFGHRRMILRIAGMGGFAGFVVLLVTQDIYWMFAAIFVASFFWSAAIPQVEAITMSLLKGDSGSYARLRAWGSIGFMVATLIGGYLMEHFGVQTMPRLVVVVMAGVAILVWWVPDAAPTQSHARSTGGVGAILRQTEVQALFIGCLLMGAAHGLLHGFYSIHLDEHGIAKSTLGWLWALGVMAEILLFWFMPNLSRRFRLRSMYLCAMGVAVVRYLMIGWGTSWLAVLVLAQLMHAFTFGVHHAVSISYVHRLFDPAHQTQGQAFYIVFTFGIGGSLGTLLTGFLWSSLGGNWLFTLASLAALLALLVCWRGLKEHGFPHASTAG